MEILGAESSYSVRVEQVSESFWLILLCNPPRTELKYRLVPLILLFLIPVLTSSMAPAHANYRITTTASDTWPSTVSQGYAVVTGVKMAMIEGNSANQIITAGSFNNGTSWTQLRVYHKTGTSLVLDSNQQWRFGGGNNYYFSGVETADLAGRGFNETITIGNVQPSGGPAFQTQIGIYRWQGGTLAREKLFNHTIGGPLETRSIAIVTNNGIRQIVTLGYYNRTGVNYAQLGIWSWDGATLSKNTLWNWTAPGTGATGSQGYAVATGDIEGNGTPDIITVGSSNNGTLTQSEIRVWGWTGSGTPGLKQSRTWVTTGQASVATSVAIQDLAGDGKKELVVGGQILSYPFWKAELSVWSFWGGLNLSQLADTYWITSSQSSLELVHVSVGDVDNSGITEIVTAGFTNMPIGTTDIDYGVIRIWTWSGSTISLQQSYQYSTVPTVIDAVTVGDIDKVGKRDIIIGGQQMGKGFLEVRDATFVSSIISLTTNPSPALAGQSVTVSGTLTNATDSAPLVSMQILLEYNATCGSYSIIATATTDSQGRFATSFTPPGPSSYNVRATWLGDNSHSGSTTSATLTLNKAPSVIVLSSSSFNAQVGDTITISGYQYPATAARVTLAYNGPGGTTITHPVNSTATGSFTDQYAVSSAGTWTISASWTGTTTTASSTSNTLSVQTRPQPPPLVTTTAFYTLILAISALAVGTFAVIWKGRSRASQPTVVPTTVMPSK